MKKRSIRSVQSPFSLDLQSEEGIVFSETADGLELRGILMRPKGGDSAIVPLIVWLHTRQRAFAEREYIGIGRLLGAKGYSFLSVDTRGHDFGAWYQTPGGPSLHGSAWERFSDSVYDIDAWINTAKGLGYSKVILAGHGFGGAKVLHFQAQRQHPDVEAVVLASSASSVRDKLKHELAELAQTMVAEGRGDDLMPWDVGEDNYSSTVSAEYYLSRSVMRRELYGTAGLPPAIARVRCPIIAWFGRGEHRDNRRVSELLEWMRLNAVKTTRFEGHMIDDLPFFYRGKEVMIVDRLLRSLENVGLGQMQGSESA